MHFYDELEDCSEQQTTRMNKICVFLLQETFPSPYYIDHLVHFSRESKGTNYWGTKAVTLRLHVAYVKT